MKNTDLCYYFCFTTVWRYIFDTQAMTDNTAVRQNYYTLDVF